MKLRLLEENPFESSALGFCPAVMGYLLEMNDDVT
jgi:hypothetical protein